jgi:hypothetical protein
MNLSSKVRQFIRRLQRGTGLPTSTQLLLSVAAPATNPWLASRDTTTPIISDAGAQIARINCILRDGNGQPLSEGILKVYFDTRGAVVDSTATTGTILMEFNGSDDAGPGAGVTEGGMVLIQANTSGVVNFVTGAYNANGDKVIVLEHLGHTVTATVNLA